MLEGIAQSLALAATLTISLNGEVAVEATQIEGDTETGAVTLRNVTVQPETELAPWLHGGPIDGDVQLVALDRRGGQVFTVDLNEIKVRGYLRATRRGDTTHYESLTLMDPPPPPEEDAQ